MTTFAFDDRATGGLGALSVEAPEGTFAPSAATRVALEAIGSHRGLLRGDGLDWGCGIGILGLAAARIPTVGRVVGLDLDAANIVAARANGARLGLSERCSFHVADSLRTVDAEGARAVDALRGRAGWVVANPPSSVGDDGFGFRRRVLADVAEVVAPGGIALLNVSSQYGEERLAALEGGPWRHAGVLADSGPVAFDPSIPHLASALEDYVAEEARGGPTYAFVAPGDAGITAHEASRAWREEGVVPTTRWQVHGFIRRAPTGR